MVHPLDEWLAARRPPRNREWLAERLGVHKSTLSRIISGQQWPGRDLVGAIARLTKGDITADDFMSERAT